MQTFNDLTRVGSKLISREKINMVVGRILDWRKQGFSQDSVAEKLNVDRTFISRLEKIGEVSRGTRVAVIGFPVGNKEELYQIAADAGVEYIWLLDNRERWELINGKQALDFFNFVIEKINYLKEFDVVILLTSGKWHEIATALLDNQVFHINIGTTPLQEDCIIEAERLAYVLKDILEQV